MYTREWYTWVDPFIFPVTGQDMTEPLTLLLMHGWQNDTVQSLLLCTCAVHSVDGCMNTGSGRWFANTAPQRRKCCAEAWRTAEATGIQNAEAC
mmetsp:Transcript_33248/g.77761  ORF Transcript_33248/g.77761 Transcript_33248/m.77761 type:complete len:94 (+) Transcript_33248:442-723(+)